MLNVLKWRQAFPKLACISDEVSAILDENACSLRYSKGARLFGPDQIVQSLFLLVSGTVRIRSRSPASSDMTLRVVHAGDSCALTTACQLSFGRCATEAFAETDVDLVLVPRCAFDAIMRISGAFRAYVFEACARRVIDISVLIEETVSRRLDILLAEKLIAVSEPLKLKHACWTLSVELGAEPKVVLQYLSEFERRGWIALGRGLIEMADAGAIRRLARQRDVHAPDMMKGVLP